MRSGSRQLLTDDIFLAGVAILLLNDAALKYLFPGVITGKLSDIAGLFVFPFFWSIFFTRYRTVIYWVTALGFVYWKTPFSGDLITTLNNSFGLLLHRTVDYSDLFALFIMPVSYWHFERCSRQPSRQLKTIPGVVIIGVSLFSFVATTLPRYVVTLNMATDLTYELNAGREEIISRMTPGMSAFDSTETNENDSVFYITFFGEGGSVVVKTMIYENEKERTTMDLISIEHAVVSGGLFFSSFNKDKRRMETMSEQDYIELFEKKVIDQLKHAGRSRQIHYWNDRTHKQLQRNFRK